MIILTCTCLNIIILVIQFFLYRRITNRVKLLFTKPDIEATKEVSVSFSSTVIANGFPK